MLVCVFVHSVYSSSCVLLSGLEGDTLKLWFCYSTEGVQHLSVTVIPMEMPLSAAVAIQGHARAVTEAQPIGETQLTHRPVMHCSFLIFLVCLYVVYTTFLIHIRHHIKYTSCNDNHGIRPPPPEQYLTPLQQKEVCIRHLRARLKETIERLQDRWGMNHS